jgi:Tfp pilus assembly protein PilP
MKKIALILSVLVLSACTTTGESKPVDIAATVAKVCPPVRSAITLLRVNPAIQPKTLEALNYAEPYIANACNMDVPASIPDLRALSEKAIPALVGAIAESDMKPNDKEVAIIALTVAQVAIAAAH